MRWCNFPIELSVHEDNGNVDVLRCRERWDLAHPETRNLLRASDGLSNAAPAREERRPLEDIVGRSEKGDCATTAEMRGSTAAAWSAIAAPIEEPIKIAVFAPTASKARETSFFSWKP